MTSAKIFTFDCLSTFWQPGLWMWCLTFYRALIFIYYSLKNQWNLSIHSFIGHEATNCCYRWSMGWDGDSEKVAVKWHPPSEASECQSIVERWTLWIIMEVYDHSKVDFHGFIASFAIKISKLSALSTNHSVGIPFTERWLWRFALKIRIDNHMPSTWKNLILFYTVVFK